MSQDHKPDQSFDSIANKFEKNIYGSTKGKLRQDCLFHYLKQHLESSDSPLQILDAGAGTGIMAEALLNLGHNLTLLDVSEDVLVLAKERLAAQENVDFMSMGIIDIENPDYFDLILCHAVLEWLADPIEAVEHLYAQLKPGGKLSLSFFNKHAHAFSSMLYGNFDYVERGMTNKNTVRLNPNKPLVPEEVLAFLQRLGCEVVHQAGIRCIHDYMRDRNMQITHYDQLLNAELTYGTQSPYKWLGRYFHVIVRKPV